MITANDMDNDQPVDVNTVSLDGYIKIESYHWASPSRWDLVVSSQDNDYHPVSMRDNTDDEADHVLAGGTITVGKVMTVFAVVVGNDRLNRAEVLFTSSNFACTPEGTALKHRIKESVKKMYLDYIATHKVERRR